MADNEGHRGEDKKERVEKDQKSETEEKLAALIRMEQIMREYQEMIQQSRKEMFDSKK